MQDKYIIELYWNRDQKAIGETDKAYGRFCRSIAYNLLGIREDAEEVTQDGYMQAWMNIPPTRPESLKTWLAKIIRNLSINLWKKNHAQKRYSGMDVILDELGECIPSRESVEEEIDNLELGRIISKWLNSLDAEDRLIFVRRYFMGDNLRDIAHISTLNEKQLASRMFKLRNQLKNELESEGILI